jgi:hypothetical protein
LGPPAAQVTVFFERCSQWWMKRLLLHSAQCVAHERDNDADDEYPDP